MSDIKRTQSKEWLDLEFGAKGTPPQTAYLPQNQPSPKPAANPLGGVSYGPLDGYGGSHSPHAPIGLSMMLFASPSAMFCNSAVGDGRGGIFFDLNQAIGVSKYSRINTEPCGRGMQVAMCLPHQVLKCQDYPIGGIMPLVLQVARAGKQMQIDSGKALLQLINAFRVTYERQSNMKFDYHLFILADGREVFSPSDLRQFSKQRPGSRSRWRLHVHGFVVPTAAEKAQMHAQRARDFLYGLGATVRTTSEMSALLKRNYEYY